ncbi:MAG: D-alanine--D-alanine ligase [Gammaproteobacteria bacterium]|jgi:D-alanine-D-alanine ligase|nr:D-alanine--D-alanine ligase [Gammaproteobacteria bacterium]
MNKLDKIRVAVLYGGPSCEHEVSLASAINVIENLDRSMFEVIPIGIDKQGTWFLGDDVFQNESISDKSSKYIRLQCEEERMIFNPSLIGNKLQQPQHQHSILQRDSERMFDVVFPVIHGTLGEDGTIQSLLELANLPYVGCGVLSSSIGMDKDVAKRLMMHAEIPVLPFIVIKRAHWEQNTEHYIKIVTAQLSYPVFVKPANMGSSIGVHKVKDVNELSSAMINAYQYDNKVIVEKGINPIEIEVAMLESEHYGSDPIVSVVGEIRTSLTHEFYSYTSKYIDKNGAALHIPATISSKLQEKAREIAKKIFSVLDCEGMARIDLFVERNTYHIYFNEINTIPGFTQISMYPKLWEASGLKYSDLLTHLIKLAINRHVRKNQLKREYK